MTPFATFYRDLTCAAAAALISVVASLSFITSTAVPPGAHARAPSPAAASVAWFGQPEPAVLVD